MKNIDEIEIKKSTSGRFTTRDLAFIGMIIALMYIVQTLVILGTSAVTPIDA